MNNFNYEPDPEITKVRDQIIKKIGNKSLEEVNTIIKKLLSGQMDEITRLGALAARVKIIRLRIEELYETKVTKKFKKVKVEEHLEDLKEPEKKKEDWFKVKMLVPAEVNGKQIDQGVILDVSKIDGQKLIDNKKAISLDNENNKKQDNNEQKKENLDGNEVKKNQENINNPNDVVKSNEINVSEKKKEIENDSANELKTEDENKLNKNDLEKIDDEKSVDIKLDNKKVSKEESILNNDEKNSNNMQNIENIDIQDTEYKKNEEELNEKSELKNDNKGSDENKKADSNNKSINDNNASIEEKVSKNKDKADLLKIHEEKAKNEAK